MDWCPIQKQSMTLIRLSPRKPGIALALFAFMGRWRIFDCCLMFSRKNEVNLLENFIKQKKVKQDCFCTPVYKSMTCKQVDLITFCLGHTFCKMILRPALKWIENNVTSLTSLNSLCIFQNACGIRYR